MAKEKSKRESRHRNWTFVVYPESAPANWRDIIDEHHIEWIESPLHDKDVIEDGETKGRLKKPHWHILVLFDGPKTYEQAKQLTNAVNAPIPQVAMSAKGVVRYMAHMDNPEKAQYSKNDIVSHGGIDITNLIKPTSASRYELIREMVQYIKDNDVTMFIDLSEYAMNKRYDDWFPLLCDNCSYYITQVIKSNAYKLSYTSEKSSDRNIDSNVAFWEDVAEIKEKELEELKERACRQSANV